MRSFYLVFFFLLLSYSTVAQNSTQEDSEDNSILRQFDKVINKSNSYENYKVIPKVNLIQLKKSVLDTLDERKENIQKKEEEIKKSHQQIAQLNGTINDLEENLTTVKNEKDSISLFGILVDKSTYSLIMWGIILILASLLGWYIFKYIRSNVITRKSVNELKELQEEYENHRKASLEREQKVRRQLQDEINKNRGVQ